MSHLKTGLGILFLLLILCSMPANAGKNTEKVRVHNATNKTLSFVKIVHKYSDNYKDSHTYTNIGPNKYTASSMKVRFNTGIGTTGKDWWYVVWAYQGENRVYRTSPNNFRDVIDGMEKAGQILIPITTAAIGAVACATCGPAAAAATAAGLVAGEKLSMAMLNNASTAGFKQHILRSGDKVSTIKINKRNGVVFLSNSGKSKTVSKSTVVKAKVPANKKTPKPKTNANQNKGQFSKLQNRWKSNQYINVERGPVASGAIQNGWHSAQWKIIDVGNGFKKICNRWKAQMCLNIERGPLVADRIKSGWHSAQWRFTNTQKGHVKICNRWKSDQCIHIQHGRLQAGKINSGWWSAQWKVNRI